MKEEAVFRRGLPRLEDTAFWARCSRRRGTLFLLFFLLAAGVLAGSLLAAWTGCFEGRELLPLFFSGIPGADAGFLSCFSTFLLNLLIFLTALFLLGVTAFGGAAVPALAFFKGAAVGLGASSFLWTDGLRGLGKSAFIYLPAASASLLLFLLFSLRALVFSEALRKNSFSAGGESLDFGDYWRDYLRFLCASAAASLLGGALSALTAVFLP